MSSAIDRAAFAWGRQIARYSLSVVRPERTVVHGREHLAYQPCIWVDWHRSNLLALAFFRQQFKRPAFGFVPPGLEGATMLGWLQSVGMTTAPLPKDGTGNPQAAIKRLARALREGLDVAIALDGPHGPAEIARPGALWLARLTGCRLVPCGFAASPSVSYPRWDRHIIPLPGARIGVAFGEPITIGRQEPVDDARLAALAEQVRAVHRQARQLATGTAAGATQAA